MPSLKFVYKYYTYYMKKVRKKYGIDGYAEYCMHIPVGRASKEVLFSGGTENAYGSKPAEFSTHDAILQHAIERSAYFSSGLIYIVDVFEVEVNDVSPLIARSSKKKEEGRDEKEEGSSDEAEKGSEVVVDTQEASIKEIEVSCLADAKDYLCNEFGYKKTQLKGAESVKRAAEEHGVVFVGSLE